MRKRHVGGYIVSIAWLLCTLSVWPADVKIRTTTLGFPSPNDPCLYDVDGDGRFEVVVSGVHGTVRAFELPSLRSLWKQTVGGTGLTAPAVGDFTGTGEPIIALASQQGEVVLLHGASGVPLAQYRLPRGVTVAPTVMPAETYLGRVCDALVLCDEVGDIHVLAFEQGQIVEKFLIPNNFARGSLLPQGMGRINYPASVGDVDGDSRPEIVVGTALGKVVALRPDRPNECYVWHGPQGSAISSNIVIADFFGLGRNALAFATDKGNVPIVIVDPDNPTERPMRTVVEQLGLAGPPNGHLLAADFDGDGTPDLIGASGVAVTAFRASMGMALFGPPYSANFPPFSPFGLAQLRSGRFCAVFADSGKMVHLYTPTHTQEGTRFNSSESFNSLPLVGNLTGDGRVECVFLARNKERLAYGVLEAAAASDCLPTLAFGGTFHRDGYLTTAALVQLEARTARFRELVEQKVRVAQEQYDNGNYGEALASAQDALTLLPSHPVAKSLAHKADLRVYWVRYVSIAGAIITAVALASWITARLVRRRTRLSQASRLLAMRNYLPAISLLKELLSRQPNNREVILLLAQAYVDWQHYPAESIPVLRIAHKLLPENQGITLALAHAYAEAGAEDQEALELYEIATALMESGRGAIAYRAGRILERNGKLEQALRYYRVAERDGCEEADVVERMADLYVATGTANEKCLPVLEKVAPSRTQDARFLEALCHAYAAAKQVGDKARSAASNLLALEPNSVIALRQLAKCELQAGRPEQALSFAERAYEIEPTDAENLLVLSYCYLSCERLDGRAIEVYRKALTMEPENPSLLRMIGLALAQSGVMNDEDYELLRRAVGANPIVDELWTALATAARQRGDHTLAIEALEKLVELGVESSNILCMLAEEYALIGDYSVKTIPAYEGALRVDPANSAYQRALARAYIAAKRADAPVLEFMENVFSQNPTELAIGEYLAEHYLQHQRFDDATKLARWLLQSDKENEHYQKLYARASLGANRLDEAIRHYEFLLHSHPDDREAQINLAVALAGKFRLDEQAAQHYVSALRLAPNLTQVRLLLARHYAQQGHYGSALDQLREVLRIDPKHQPRVLEEVRYYLVQAPDRPDLRWFLVDLLIEAGSLDEACEQLEELFALDPTQTRAMLQAYDRILSKDPNRFAALLQKGRILMAQGRIEEARPLLERAHQIEPRDAEVRNELESLYEHLLTKSDNIGIRFELAKLYYSEGNYDRAIAEFQKTAQDFRFENESLKMLGLCFMGKGMLEFALQEFQKLVLDNELKEILYELGQRYEAKGDFVGAKQVYRMLFTADVTFRDVKQKFEMLAGATSDPLQFERSTLITQLSERAQSRYELIEEVGRGAMGIVYRAHDHELDEIVALKILPDNLSQNPDALNRFRAEARAARRLSHPHIVRIHDIGEEKGRKYISMEYVKGTDLKRYLRQKKKLSPEEVVRLMIPVCEALDYAHSKNIVHRDIKPANIMLTDQGVPKVSDFGIAKALEATGETMAGAIIGTPLYMSPEQIQGQPVDHRADIYSLGIMMYELLNGAPPFTAGDLAYQHCRVMPPPIEGIPQELNAIVLKCLEKDREKRWSSAGELARALRATGLAGKP